MAQIRLLDQATINKIAAGEVVERPASVVKEMVENSIDAGADKITVEIQNGGLGLIRISDNGCGIEDQQIRTAFLRHSTSKIRTVEDLLSSTSLGFRGEALASIAAVARVEMITRPAGQVTGVRYVIEGGEEKTFEEVACPEGTTIKVENLFYNTPARRKFLKKPAAEAAAVTDLVQKIVMGHPEIAVRYVNGKKGITLQSPGTGSLKQDIFTVYGRDTADKMIPAEGTIDLDGGAHLKVEGFISRPQLVRASRTGENYYINGRFIHSSLLEKAADEAYKDYIVPGTFPVLVLHLSMDPSVLDVNVHPQKMEVRFFQEENVRRGLYQVLSEALSHQNLISREGDFYSAVVHRPDSPSAEKGTQPSFRKKNRTSRDLAEQVQLNGYVLPKEHPSANRAGEFPKADRKKVSEEFPIKTSHEVSTGISQGAASGVPKGAKKATSLETSWRPSPRKPVLTALESEPAENTLSEQGSSQTSSQTASGSRSPESGIRVHEETFAPAPEVEVHPIMEGEKRPQVHHLKLIGQLFRTYWVAQEEDVFYLIDQHAAHERVYYDQYRKMLDENHMDTQELLDPVVVSCDPRVVEQLDSYQPVLTKLGYEAEAFGEDAVIIRGVPFLFGKPLPVEDLTQMMDMLYEGSTDSARDLLIDKIATMSCKAAVKGNDELTFEEASSLLEQLFASQNPYNCPHGRPTMISVTKYELEKRFKRT